MRAFSTLLTKDYLVSKKKSGRILYEAGYYYMDRSTVNILQKMVLYLEQHKVE